MSETLQQALSAYISEEAAWRIKSYDAHRARGDEDIRVKSNAAVLTAMAAFVGQLPDEDPGIRALAAFGWPVAAFRFGTGDLGEASLLKSGFGGTPRRPLVHTGTPADAERSWAAFVRAAERDKRQIDRVLAIVGSLLDTMPQPSARARIGRLVALGKAS